MKRRQFYQTSTAWALASTLGLAAQSTKSPANKRRVAVIGHTGRGNFGHDMDTFWLDFPEAEVVAVADADENGLAKAVTRLGGEKSVAGYRDFHKMLTQEKVEIVSIATRHVDQHAAMWRAAVASGVKGIYIEKPFAATLAEADEMVALAEKHEVRSAVAHRWRWHPVIPVVKKLVSDGLVGKLLEVRLRGKEDGRGGLQDAWVLGSHEFVVAQALVGDALSCSAQLYQGKKLATSQDLRPGGEGIPWLAGDAVHARFETEAGVSLFFDSVKDAGSRAAGFGLQLIGNEGIVDFRIDTEPFAYFLPGNPFNPHGKVERQWQAISTAGLGKAEPISDLSHKVGHHLLAAQDLFAAIEEGRPTLCGARAGRHSIEMVHAMMSSHCQNGARVPMPLADRSHPFEKWKDEAAPEGK